jgi:hypothetical protein
LIELVVAPVFHRYEFKPLGAIKVIDPPEHGTIVPVEVMFGTRGNEFIVTEIPAEVTGQLF